MTQDNRPMAKQEIDLTNNKTPFGLLSFAEQEHLRKWPHGVEVYVGSGWDETCDPFWRLQAVYRTIPAPEREEWFVVLGDDGGGYSVASEKEHIVDWQNDFGGIIYRVTTDLDGSNPEIEVVE